MLCVRTVVIEWYNVAAISYHFHFGNRFYETIKFLIDKNSVEKSSAKHWPVFRLKLNWFDGATMCRRFSASSSLYYCLLSTTTTNPLNLLALHFFFSRILYSWQPDIAVKECVHWVCVCVFLHVESMHSAWLHQQHYDFIRTVKVFVRVRILSEDKMKQI